ncbi:radical SAM protein [Desulfurispora thermophila]|uniref:radical SAM protein n=1 Tax=Desulfurispora thermophila TaxID=265470 RepID=UPI0003723567|nr:radical SAM protein [Desulfurispora thermophila]
MRLLYCDQKGNFFDHPYLKAAGRSGRSFAELTPDDMIPLPDGASLVMLPGCQPVGMKKGRLVRMESDPQGGGPVWAVGALLPQGYTRTWLPGYIKPPRANLLPLYGYTAVAWHKGSVWVAARLTDDPQRWDPANYESSRLPQIVRQRLDASPGNRILAQLATCTLQYRCFTATNIFLQRWEGGVPVSPVCNARCLGCISRQPAGCCPAPQSRINFRPDVAEVVEVMSEHLQAAGPEGIISFGQGCEGDPALAWPVVSESIARVRRLVTQGTINMNTNAGHTAGVEAICRAGLDAIRVSMISARPQVYHAYYRPAGYQLTDVIKSIETARSLGVQVSLNLLALPGLTDLPLEMAAWQEFLQSGLVNMVQLRNLNIDPDYLLARLPGLGQAAPAGMDAFLQMLEQIPGLKVGNFTHPVGR